MSSNHPEPTIQQYASADRQAVLDICIAAFTPIDHRLGKRRVGIAWNYFARPV
jgi:hypothetical protein